MPVGHARLVVVAGVHLGMVGDGEDDRLHEEGQHRQLGLIRRPVGVETVAQRFEVGDVDLLDIGDVGDPLPGRLEASGDGAAQPDHLDRLHLPGRLAGWGGVGDGGRAPAAT